MRGVCLRGRRLPANRSAGPARPPVVPAAVPALPARPGGRRLRHRPKGRARRAASHSGRHPWEYYPQRRCQSRHHLRHRAPCGLAALRHPHMTGTTTAILAPAGRSPAPIVDAAIGLPAWAAALRPPSGQSHRPARGAACCRLRQPGRGQDLPGTVACPAPAPVLPRKPALRALAGPCSGAASSPVRPPIGHRLRGAVATPDQSRPRADLAGQPSHGTGHGPDPCRYRQPGATGCRACHMFPIACYGLTPRCREVKR